MASIASSWSPTGWVAAVPARWPALAGSVVGVAFEDASPQLATFNTTPSRVGREEIRQLLEQAVRAANHPAEAALAGLSEQACSRGGSDDITGIVFEVARESAAPDELLDEAPTNPISLPPDAAPTPIVAVADDALSAFVEQGLRESSGLHSAPRD